MPQPVPALFDRAAARQSSATASRSARARRRRRAAHGTRRACGRRSRACRRADGIDGLVSASVARSRQAGPDRGERGGPAFRQRGMFLPRFRRGDVRDARREPAIPAWLICDAVFIRRYGLGAVHPGGGNFAGWKRAGTSVRADTLEALAGKIGGQCRDNWRVTVARHNGFAETGIDDDFGKGETELNRFNGDPRHKPNPCIGPIATPPFYALAVYPADDRGEHGACNRRRRARARRRRRGDRRPLRLRQRHGVGHGRQLSGAGNDARSGHRVRLPCSDARARRR